MTCMSESIVKGENIEKACIKDEVKSAFSNLLIIVHQGPDGAELEDQQPPEHLPRGLALEGRLMVEEGQVELVDLLAEAARGHHEAIATD